MEDDVMPAEPRKSGCLKWTCGCLACGVVVVGLGAALLWHLLGRWNPGDSAWERLPPSTLLAVEVHDVKTLLGHVVNDQGMRAMLEYGARHASGPGGEGTLADTRDFLDEISTLHRRLAPVFTLIAPNTILFGFGGPDGDDVFVMFKPPALMGWHYGFSEKGGVGAYGDNEEPFHFAMKDGWLVASDSPDMVQEVVDNWDRGGAPLGAAVGGKEAFLACAVAARREKETAPGGEASEDRVQEGLMFGDPFAAAQPTAKEFAVRNLGARFAVFPSDAGWLVLADAAENLEHAPSLLRSAEKPAAPDVFSMPPEGFDFGLAARAAPDLRALALRRLAEDLEVDPATAHPNRALAWRWLNDGWLANAQSDLCVLGKPPAATGETAFPPLPVTSLGWVLRDGVSPRAAGEAFTDALTLWLDSLRSPGGPEPLQNLRGGIAYAVNRDGAAPAGVVELPAVAVNGARPAWRFPDAAKPPMGWLATDPEGVPGDGKRETPDPTLLARPEPGQVLAAAAWDMRGEFLDAWLTLLLDRLGAMPDPKDAEYDKEDVMTAIRAGKQVLAAFPRGRFILQCDVEKRTATFRMNVPPGREVRFE